MGWIIQTAFLVRSYLGRTDTNHVMPWLAAYFQTSSFSSLASFYERIRILLAYFFFFFGFSIRVFAPWTFGGVYFNSQNKALTGYWVCFLDFLFLSLSTSWINQRHLEDSLTYPSDETVQELARILDENLFVNVRGTPASGKSVLAQFLRDHYRSKNVPVILFRTWHRDQTED